MDTEPITAWRTAAAATHNALTLARPGPAVVVATGAQARAQVFLLASLRPAEPVTVVGRDHAAARATTALRPAGRTTDSIKAAVYEARPPCTAAPERPARSSVATGSPRAPM
ncbi:hypothetical protein ABZ890_15665 [Streptomyces sp. NPDC046984]|uniref:hypothetical protein n=1 Tax=Streptomyces sp. NPDC046984 TaxID=3155138 RepID=UPI0033C6904D